MEQCTGYIVDSERSGRQTETIGSRGQYSAAGTWYTVSAIGRRYCDISATGGAGNRFTYR